MIKVNETTIVVPIMTDGFSAMPNSLTLSLAFDTNSKKESSSSRALA